MTEKGDPVNTMKQKKHKIKLFNWILQSYLKTIIIPLGVIALLFILVFTFTNKWHMSEIEQYLALEAQENLSNIASKESAIIEKQLEGIENSTRFYQLETANALHIKTELLPEDSQRLGYSSDNAFVTTSDKPSGGAAVFLSNITSVDEDELSRIASLFTMETMMKNLLLSNPLLVSIYFNAYDSLNFIYPYFDTSTQYPPDMDIPDYNFYYEADATHNPARDTVWTDVYLDPAGHGWMVSSIAPVYQDDFLSGVVGIDVTVDTIANEILQMNIPWNGYGVLLSKDGMIMAMPKQGELDFGLDEMTTHTYSEAIIKDTFKPEKFNINNREDTKELATAMKNSDKGYLELFFGGRQQVVTWSSIKGADWNLVVFVPHDEIFKISHALTSRMEKIVIYMVIGLIIASMGIFIIIFLSARRYSSRISKPLEVMNLMLKKIGKGVYDQEAMDFPVDELNETGMQIVQMGKELEKALNSNSLLKSASSLKSEFIANMSHEIRTPVNAILGFSMILEKQITDLQQKQHIETIKKACNTLLNIINDILDLSKLDAGGVKLHLESVDLESEMNNIEELFRYEQRKKSLKMEVHFDPQLPRLLVLDGIRIRQILLNLVGNAFKFTETGSISISAWNLGPGIEPGSVNLKIAVLDTGIGIEENQHKKIFEPFIQTENQNIRKYGGTGLGLAIVKRFVELMKGTISVQSSPGRGSTFTIELPNVMGVDLNTDLSNFNDQESTSDFDEPDNTPQTESEYQIRDLAEIMGTLAESELKVNLTMQQDLNELCDVQCKLASQTNRIKDFHEVASRLLSIGDKYNAGAVISFAKTLQQAADSYDLDLIRRLLNEIIDLNDRISGTFDSNQNTEV